MKKLLNSIAWGLIILLWIASISFGWRLLLWMGYLTGGGSFALPFLVLLVLFVLMLIIALIVKVKGSVYFKLFFVPAIMCLLVNVSLFFINFSQYSIKDDCVNGVYAFWNRYNSNDNSYGLMDKFGSIVVEPIYGKIVRVFSNDREDFVIVGVKRNGKSFFVLHIYDEKYRVLREVVVKESCYGNITAHIENEIGSISSVYADWYFTDGEKLKEASSRPPKIDLSRKKVDRNFEQEDAVRDNVIEHKERVDRSDSKPQVSERQKSESHETHVPQEVMKERWRPCTACDRGKCRQCNGRGYYYNVDMRMSCLICNMTGRCPYCEGRGETIEFYSVWE